MSFILLTLNIGLPVGIFPKLGGVVTAVYKKVLKTIKTLF